MVTILAVYIISTLITALGLSQKIFAKQQGLYQLCFIVNFTTVFGLGGSSAIFYLLLFWKFVQ